ncbi:MAG: hypothetical protein K8R63_06535 [Bacteroidales bacterium]|nr:hypothetical protein [Bacteroidales bacterium]
MNNKRIFQGFIRKTAITTIVVIAAGMLLFTNIPAEYYSPAFPFIVGFFFFVTIIVFYYMLKAVDKRPARFVNVFMLTTMLKLMLYLAVMVVYVLLNREDAKPFILTYLVLYIIYTVLEVGSILKVNKEKSRGTPPPAS